MADPKVPKVIGIKAPSGSEGEYVIVRNLSRGGKLKGQLNSKKETILNPAPSSQWQSNDDIQVEMRGRVTGVKKTTLKGGTNSITLSVSTDTSTPGVSL